MMIDWWSYTEGTSPGFMIIVDMKGITFSHITRLNPMTLKYIFDYLQEAIPIRLKAMHFINTTQVMDVLMSLIKPLIKKELMEMVSLTNIRKYINLKTEYKTDLLCFALNFPMTVFRKKFI